MEQDPSDGAQTASTLGMKRPVSPVSELQQLPICPAGTELDALANQAKRPRQSADPPDQSSSTAPVAPMTAAEAIAAAAAEGLKIFHSYASKTGYLHVRQPGDAPSTSPFELKVHGKHLGFFATAEEAALSYSRSFGRERLAKQQEAAASMRVHYGSPHGFHRRGPTTVHMTAAEALAAAEAEGLKLFRSSTNETGYKYVRIDANDRTRPFELRWDDKHIGYFATAEEAALAYARIERRRRDSLGSFLDKDQGDGWSWAYKQIRRCEAKETNEPNEPKRPRGRPKGSKGRTRPMPEPPKNAYLCFAQERRRELFEEWGWMLDEHGTIVVRVESEVNRQWMALSTEQRKKWKEASEKDLERYRDECAAAGIEPKQSTCTTAQTGTCADTPADGSDDAQAATGAHLDLTAEEALAVAEAEGLPLVGATNETGFKYVKRDPNCTSRPYQLQIDQKSLGYFATPEAAALWYARYIGRAAAEREAARAVRVDLTVQEALAAAEAEGLTLVPSDTSTSGYHRVHLTDPGCHGFKSRFPYRLARADNSHHGYYMTAEEAALNYARMLGPEAAKAEAAKMAARAVEARARVVQASSDAALLRMRLLHGGAAMTAVEALAAAEAEGLNLIPSRRNSSGYKYVYYDAKSHRKPFAIRPEGSKSLGFFVTAEEAALNCARYLNGTFFNGGQPEDGDPAGKLPGEATEGESSEATAVVDGAGRGQGEPGPHKTRHGACDRWVPTCDELAMTAEEALAAAEAEGMPLIRSDLSATGFKYVLRDGQCHTRPFALRRCSPGHFFAAAEGAALYYARQIGREAAELEISEYSQKLEKAKAREAAREAKEAKAREQAAAAAVAAEVRAREKEALKEARERDKEAAKAILEEHKRQQAAREELMAQRQRAMLQEAAERQRQRQRQTGRPVPPAQATPAGGGGGGARSAEVGDMTTAALIEQVLRDRTAAHLCLGVDFFAPRDVVRKRYLALVLRLHPDKVAHPRAAEAFAAVEAAFRKLCGDK